MIIPPKYAAINWADGMKVNKEHFIAAENYNIDHLRDAASIGINNYNFGLLAPLRGSGAQLSNYEVVKTATNQVQIRVSHCQAITPGGLRISITEEGAENNSLTQAIRLSEESAEALTDGHREYFYVVMVINPFDRVPSGNPDPEETPIRQPFVQPRYELQLIHANNVSPEQLGGYYLVIGRIVKNGGDYSRDETFIPPCNSITANQRLMEHYQQAGKAIEDLQNYSLQIIGKINYKNQKSDVAQNLKNLCRAILAFTSDHYFSFRNLVHQQPPAHLIQALSVFASHIFTAVQTLPEKEKEELLNYFFEWSDVSPIIFISRLSAVIEINYSHYHTGQHFIDIQEMLIGLVAIWQKLNGLEFIGQHKENIVVKEETLMPAVKERKGWSIID